MKIQLKTAMIFDAICACSLIYNHGNYTTATQTECLEILKERTGETFKEGAPSFSTICHIVEGYIDDPSCATLDDLYLMFKSISDVDFIIRGKVKNEYLHSFIFPMLDMLKNGGAEKYCEYITALKDAGFEDLWREKVLPAELEQINKLQGSFKASDIDSILKTVSDLKCSASDSVTVYISLLSYPVSFSLGKGMFLNAINNRADYYKSGFLSMIAHELMHGFASAELTSLYLKFMDSSRYLRSTHNFLINNMHSGDEEELVMAAEYYILWHSKILSKRQIVLNNYSRYGGCVPMALYIFNHTTNEQVPIENYDRWLTNRFLNKTFKTDNVFSTLDSLLPVPKDSESFFAGLFLVLQRCSYILRDAQLNTTEDIKTKIEQLTNAKFTLNNQRLISFANSTNELAEDVIRETLTNGLLTVEKLEFQSKKDAFSLHFAYKGANVSAPTLEYDGEKIEKPYTLNMAFHKDKSNRAEFSFVLGNARYLITSACPDYVVDIDTKEDEDATCRRFGQEMTEAFKKAESIVLLLK